MYAYIHIYIYIYIYIERERERERYAIPPAASDQICHLSMQSLWKFCGELRRFEETVIFPCDVTNKCCGELRRQ